MSENFISIITFATLISLFWLLVFPKFINTEYRWIYDDRRNNPAMFKLDRVNEFEYIRFFKQLYAALAVKDYEYLKQVAAPELVIEFEKNSNNWKQPQLVNIKIFSIVQLGNPYQFLVSYNCYSETGSEFQEVFYFKLGLQKQLVLVNKNTPSIA